MPPASASLFSRVLKILILQDVLRSGGTERQSIVLTKGLLANGLDARLVTFRPGGALAAGAAELPGRALQVPDRGWDWHSPGLAAELRRKQPDFVLAMGRMANCRLGWLSAGPAQKIATFRTGKPIPWLYRRALGTAAHVIANSRESAETLTNRYGVPAERITVIYNGLVFRPLPVASNSPPDGLALREKLGAGPGTKILLCVAMLRPEKRQVDLLDILAGLPGQTAWQLWLVGDGPERPVLERRAEELGLRDKVRFLGFQADPSPFYAAADIAVHASERESLSNFLIEAQANGLPVVAYAAQGIPECLLPGRTGEVIARGDAEAFRAALVKFAGATPAEREQLRREAVRFARERFESEGQIQAYVRLLRRLQSGAS